MEKNKLFIGSLPWSITNDSLKELFAQYGEISEAIVINDRDTGRSKGFGFVEMEKEEEAEKAIKTLHDTDFGGRKLVVAEAKPMEKREFTPRSGGGDDRRGGYSSGGRGGFAPRSGGSRGGGDACTESFRGASQRRRGCAEGGP